jgi:hypothetical protein
VPGLPGAFSRRACLLALRRRSGAADAAGGEGLASASGSSPGAGRRRRGAGPGTRHRGPKHPRHGEWRGVTVAWRVAEEYTRAVVLLLVAAVNRMASCSRLRCTPRGPTPAAPLLTLTNGLWFVIHPGTQVFVTERCWPVMPSSGLCRVMVQLALPVVGQGEPRLHYSNSA